jgi:hypothetical protein
MPITSRERPKSVSTSHIHLNQPGNQRRSQRVLLSVGIRVTAKRANGISFEENTRTLVVNAHGALIQLKEIVNPGDDVIVRNLRTEEELSCKVVDISAGANGLKEVGIEFVASNPKFWRITFPPADWTARSPEAKRFATPSAVRPKGSTQPQSTVKKS